MNLSLRLVAESVAMLMIGDGALMLLQPRRHLSLWNAGPEGWRDMVSYLEDRPMLTRAVGAAQLLAGAWLAQSLRPAEDDVYDALGAEAHVPSTAWQDYDAVVH